MLIHMYGLLLCSVLSSPYPRYMASLPGQLGLVLTMLNESKTVWSVLFLTTQSLAFMTVISMWTCKSQIYDSNMIHGLFFVAAVCLLAKLGA